MLTMKKLRNIIREAVGDATSKQEIEDELLNLVDYIEKGYYDDRLPEMLAVVKDLRERLKTAK